MKPAPVQLSRLLQDLVDVPPALDIEITHLTSDSRDVVPGSLFIAMPVNAMPVNAMPAIAMPNLSRDGGQFIVEAVARGARAVVREGVEHRVQAQGGVVQVELTDLRAATGRLAQRFFGDISARVPLIGVTGTNGKSSTTHYIAQMLAELGQPCGLIGTLGYGVLPHLREASHTTPDCLRLHRELAEMEASGARAVAMEVSSHALDQQRIAGLRFQGAVFTNLSRDHLDYHGDMAGYAAAKQRLFERGELSFAVINRDDAYGLQLLNTLAPDVARISFAVSDSEADLRVARVRYDHQGIEAEIHYGDQRGRLRCGLMGDFNLSNLLAAAGVLLSLGHPLEVVLNCAENLQPVLGRMQKLPRAAGPVVIVDYAHTPDALDQALRATALHQPGRIWCVFGCGGDRDRGKRPLMAAIVARHGAHLVVTNDNPRTESPEQIVQDILAGAPSDAAVTVEPDRECAIAWAIEQADAADIVLIAGKGHESYQDMQGVRTPFSDVAVASRYLDLRQVPEVRA